MIKARQPSGPSDAFTACRGRRQFLRSALSVSAVILIAIAVPPVPGHAQTTENLVTNGGFEQPAIPSRSFRAVATVPGWTIAPGSTGTTFELQNNIAGAPAEGNQHVELDAAIGIQQVVPGATLGTYILAFNFSPRPGTTAADNRVQVLWNGQPLGPIIEGGPGGPTTSWTCYSFLVTGGLQGGTITFRGAGTANQQGTYLDNVILRRPNLTEALVAPAPAPGVCALAGQPTPAAQPPPEAPAPPAATPVQMAPNFTG